ncbi:serine/threonine protein phosphatase, partial [Candidatus Falkowbacteria bacterium]|nr:serine/threonine protein phosphatase [Candidatus Falkowbacteria bacterium]
MAQAPFAPLRPARPVLVIGDVHGCLPLLERMLARAGAAHPKADLVLVGDLIDRGEQSAGVLRLVFERRGDLVVLLGNHEEMLLRFLEAPETEAARWFRNGGLQTMASFGIGPIGAAPDPDLCRNLRDRLRVALGADLEAWLRSL